MIFDHEKLDVYQASLEFVKQVSAILEGTKEVQRSARDQLIRASMSIPLNIAEGNGKRSPAERKRFLEIARGSAMECAAILDIIVVMGALSADHINGEKRILERIVAMLSKMTERIGPLKEKSEASVS